MDRTEEGNAQYGGGGQKLCTVCRDPLSRRDMYEYEYHSPPTSPGCTRGAEAFFSPQLGGLEGWKDCVSALGLFLFSLRVLVMWWGGHGFGVALSGFEALGWRSRYRGGEVE